MRFVALVHDWRAVIHPAATSSSVQRSSPRRKLIHDRWISSDNSSGFSDIERPHIGSIDGSLKRLGTDYINFYYQHRVDPRVKIEETELAAPGKVRHIPLSQAALSSSQRRDSSRDRLRPASPVPPFLE